MRYLLVMVVLALSGCQTMKTWIPTPFGPAGIESEAPVPQQLGSQIRIRDLHITGRAAEIFASALADAAAGQALGPKPELKQKPENNAEEGD